MIHSFWKVFVIFNSTLYADYACLSRTGEKASFPRSQWRQITKGQSGQIHTERKIAATLITVLFCLQHAWQPNKDRLHLLIMW